MAGAPKGQNVNTRLQDVDPDQIKFRECLGCANVCSRTCEECESGELFEENDEQELDFDE